MAFPSDQAESVESSPYAHEAMRQGGCAVRGMWRRACLGDRLDRLMLVLLQLSLAAGSLLDGSAVWNWRAGCLI